MVDVGTSKIINSWDPSKLLNNFSPHVRRDLYEKDMSVEALVSCLLYIASSKGDNLGLGYVVDKLKWDPQDGQGGIYRRLAEEVQRRSLPGYGTTSNIEAFKTVIGEWRWERPLWKRSWNCWSIWGSIPLASAAKRNGVDMDDVPRRRNDGCFYIV